MIVKLIAIGALGYAGYRYFTARLPKTDGVQDIRLAGGPLSSAATVQHSADLPPQSP
jgi:hypothetical protein